MSDQQFHVVKNVDAPLSRRATVFFLHGFLGEKHSTWQKEPNNQDSFWPDWLAKSFPYLRIITVSYATPATSDSMSLEDKATLLLRDLRRYVDNKSDPYIFICHSMGGILVKRMLLMADVEVDKNIIDNMRSIFFFATPHLGSRIAERLNEYLPGVVIRNKVLKDLSLNGSYLRFLNSTYRRMLENEFASHIQHYDFCETRRVYGLLRVVDEQSSRLYEDDIPGKYEVTRLGYNHISICKFSHSDDSIDSRFQNVISLLDRVFVNTGALDDRKDWSFLPQSESTNQGVLHIFMCVVAAFLGIIVVPVAVVLKGTVDSIDPHPFWEFALQNQRFIWISALFAMSASIVITYACRRLPILWSAAFGMLGSILLVSFIHWG